MVLALKNSTHKIEWMPVKNPYENKEEDVEEAFDELNDPLE